MKFFKKALIYSSFTFGVPFLWYKIGLYDINNVRNKCFNAGINTSQKFKKYPFWDKYVEPFIIKQSAILFTAGYSFIEGMASDNPKKFNIEKDMDEMDEHINNEINKDKN
jgi:hypothetical protein